jgi:hypothetical protein
MPDQDNWAFRIPNRALGCRDVVLKRVEGILDGNDLQPRLLEYRYDLLPRRTVGKRAVYEYGRLSLEFGCGNRSHR